MRYQRISSAEGLEYYGVICFESKVVGPVKLIDYDIRKCKQPLIMNDTKFFSLALR